MEKAVFYYYYYYYYYDDDDDDYYYYYYYDYCYYYDYYYHYSSPPQIPVRLLFTCRLLLRPTIFHFGNLYCGPDKFGNVDLWTDGMRFAPSTLKRRTGGGGSGNGGGVGGVGEGNDEEKEEEEKTLGVDPM